jgi:hypothetical protein
MTELSDAQIRELQEYPAGPKFVQLYSEEVQRLKQLRTQLMNERQTLERAKLLFTNWQKTETEKHQRELEKIQKRLDEVITEVENWKATEGLRQKAEIAHAEKQITIKTQLLNQIQEQIAEVERQIIETRDKIEALKDPERFKRLKEIELEQLKQLEQLGQNIENLSYFMQFAKQQEDKNKYVPSADELNKFDALIREFDQNLRFLDEISNIITSQ